MGPKGAGKSTVRSYLEKNYDFISVYMEQLYAEFDPNRKFTVDKPSESLRDKVYEEAKKRIIELSRQKNVVFDGTGSSGRFILFLKAIKAACPSSKVIYIDSDKETAFARTQTRDLSSHRPFDRDYFNNTFTACLKHQYLADLTILNNKTIQDLLKTTDRLIPLIRPNKGYITQPPVRPLLF